jgi:hypothetical protein
MRCLAETATANTGPFVPVSRILGVDESGILYIGKAGSETRLANLLKSVASRYIGFGHAFGVRYKVDDRFLVRFPEANLIIELVPTSTPDATELEFLERYEASFGELPPFNHSKRKRPNSEGSVSP